ncbi:hypothetical protein BJI67_05915 [Acidihalobacter aeolianus]|uniref:Uncharacterized protein n=1 Tax=Acidihalobacter aeolianus TaxID=2792603 RepID=A0A1D8K6W7_9GAMM|nr:hypothetical protein BJI67_05915 [Acidihalobacter aeolianus]
MKGDAIFAAVFDDFCFERELDALELPKKPDTRVGANARIALSRDEFIEHEILMVLRLLVVFEYRRAECLLAVFWNERNHRPFLMDLAQQTENPWWMGNDFVMATV